MVSEAQMDMCMRRARTSTAHEQRACVAMGYGAGRRWPLVSARHGGLSVTVRVDVRWMALK